MKAFLTLIISVVVIVAICAFEGWLFSFLWNWLTPLFWAGAPVLTIWQGFGIIFLINFVGKLLFGSKK